MLVWLAIKLFLVPSYQVFNKINAISELFKPCMFLSKPTVTVLTNYCQCFEYSRRSLSRAFLSFSLTFQSFQQIHPLQVMYSLFFSIFFSFILESYSLNSLVTGNFLCYSILLTSNNAQERYVVDHMYLPLQKRGRLILFQTTFIFRTPNPTNWSAI